MVMDNSGAGSDRLITVCVCDGGLHAFSSGLDKMTENSDINHGLNLIQCT